MRNKRFSKSYAFISNMLLASIYSGAIEHRRDKGDRFTLIISYKPTSYNLVIRALLPKEGVLLYEVKLRSNFSNYVGCYIYNMQNKIFSKSYAVISRKYFYLSLPFFKTLC